MNRVKCCGQALIGKAATQARREGCFRAGSQCLDQQHLQQPFQHEFACRPALARFLTDQLHQRRKSGLVTNDNHLRQEGSEQGRIRRPEAAMPYTHAQIRRPFEAADTEMAATQLRWNHGGQTGRCVDTLVDKVAHSRNEHEIAGSEDERLMSSKRYAAMPLKDCAVEWLACGLAMNSPGAGAFHQLRKAGGRLQQRDDFGKGIDGHNQD